jgi:hypothetical protein
VASAVGAGAITIQSVHELFVKAKLGLDNPESVAQTNATGPEEARRSTRAT